MTKNEHHRIYFHHNFGTVLDNSLIRDALILNKREYESLLEIDEISGLNIGSHGLSAEGTKD